ncbi:MAG: branched-chain amino acid ABC transporter permease [Acidimicrobiales bacterium]
MSLFVETIGFGIFTGCVVALGAVGFSVQFGISNVLNVAYGTFLTLGAYLGYVLNTRHVNLWLSVLIVGLVIAVISVAFNRLLPAKLMDRGAGFVVTLIATVWAGIGLLYVIIVIAGPSAYTYRVDNGSTHTFAGFVLTTSQLIVIVAAVALMFVYHLLLTRTQLGKAMRATSVNPVVARSCGIPVRRVIDAAWFISGLLCGMAGVVLAGTTATFGSTLGTTFLIYMIAAAVLGGIGQPYGAMIGGLVVGLTTQLVGAYSSPAYEDVAAFVILTAMLLIRPQGLLGSAATAGRRLAGG